MEQREDTSFPLYLERMIFAPESSTQISQIQVIFAIGENTAFPCAIDSGVRRYRLIFGNIGYTGASEAPFYT